VTSSEPRATPAVEQPTSPRRVARGKVLLFALLGVIAYLSVGVLLVPKWVQQELAVTVADAFGARLMVRRVIFNPLTLNATLEAVTFVSAGGAEATTIGRLTLGFSPVSPLTSARRLRIVRAEQAEFTLHLPAADAGLQPIMVALDDTLTRLSNERRLRISRLEVIGAVGEIVPGNASPAQPLFLQDLDVRLNGVDSGKRLRADFRLRSTVNGTARLAASGWLIPQPVTVNTRVMMTGSDLSLSDFWLAGPRGGISAGRVAATATLQYRDARVRLAGRVNASDLTVPDAYPANAATVGALMINDLYFQSEPQHLAIGELKLQRPELTVTRDADGRLHRPAWFFNTLAAADQERTVVRHVSFDDGRVTFFDHTLAPPATLTFDQLNGRAEPRRVSPTFVRRLTVHGRVASGAGQVVVTWQPGSPLAAASFSLELRSAGLQKLGPYLAAATGHTAVAGTADFRVRGRVLNRTLRLENHASLQGLRLAPAFDEAADNVLPVELALALLEDQTGRAAIDVPVARTVIGPGFKLESLLRDQVSAFVTEVTAAPFDVVGALVNRPGEAMRRVAFAAGDATINPDAATSLIALRDALEQRPRLGVAIRPGYDLEIDGVTLARRQVRLHVALATSEAPGGRASEGSPAFGNPKVQRVLDEFADKRLEREKRLAFQEQFPESGEGYYAAVYEALVATEPVSPNAFRSLARYRGRAVVDNLIDAGIDAGRLQVADQPAGFYPDSPVAELELESLTENRELQQPF